MAKKKIVNFLQLAYICQFVGEQFTSEKNNQQFRSEQWNIYYRLQIDLIQILKEKY